jgi:hypothetical protein
MTDATVSISERLRVASQILATAPFYIGTSRRQVEGIILVVHLNLEHGAVAGYVSAELHSQPQQAGQQHLLTATAVALRGEDRERVLSAGVLDESGRYPIPGMAPQLRYFLHLGTE